MSGVALHKYAVPAAAGISHLAVPDLLRSNYEPRTTIKQCIRDAVTHIRAAAPGTLAGCLLESAQVVLLGIKAVCVRNDHIFNIYIFSL